MKGKIISIIIAGAFTCGLGVTTAIAADEGFYAYAASGVSNTKRKSEIDTSLTNAGAVFTSTADEKGVAYKVQAGYQINPYLAVEGGYMDMGKHTYDAVATVPLGATRQGSIKTTGWNLDAVGSFPVSEVFSIFARAGAVYYDLSSSCSGAVIACVNPNRNTKDTAFHYGAGVEWNVWDRWFVRAEYEVVSKVGEALNATGTTGTTKADVTMFTGGIGYRF